MNKDGKILITGTGRSGTTFLIILCTHLGMNTGYNVNNYRSHISEKCNSGMEHHNLSKLPPVSKNPNFLRDIEKVLQHNKVNHVLIPIRDYDKSAKSRESYGGNNANGGLIGGAQNANQQKAYYFKVLSNYLLSMVRHNIPTTFIDFDRMISSPEYLFEKMQPILKNVTYEKFLESYQFATKDQKRK